MEGVVRGKTNKNYCSSVCKKEFKEKKLAEKKSL